MILSFLPHLRFHPFLIGLSSAAVLGLAPPALASSTDTAQTGRVCPADLDAQVQAIVNQPSVRTSRWGIAVETVSTSYTDEVRLYEKNATQFFVPASNAKIFVTAAALHALGADYRIRTSVYREPSLIGDEVILRVKGRGDPSLTDAQLQDLAVQLRDRGITRVDRLIIDDSYFQGDRVSPSWEAEDLQAGYGAPTNSLILNTNAIAITLYPQAVGQPLRLVWEDPQEAAGWQVQNNTRTVSRSEGEYIYVGRDMTRPILYLDGQLQEGAAPDLSAIAITNPASYFLDHVKTAFSEVGIQVLQTQVQTVPVAEAGEEIAVVESPPLSSLITEANRNSTNLYAEALLRLVGVTDSPDTTSALVAGASAVPRILSPLDVDSRGITLADGAGLSRQNLVTPVAVVDTLQAMARSPQAEIYQESLAVAGLNGTLQSRFQNTDVAGRLWGKTGTLRDTVALSGYLYPAQYEAIAFSILVNDPDLSVAAARQTIDEIVLLLSRLQECQSAI